jgi:hypothetical protein
MIFMKKVILGIAALGLSAAFVPSVHAQDAVKEVQQDESIKIPTPPKFASEDVNKGVGELVSLIKEYAPAIETQDSAKMMEFGAKVQAWQQNAASWAVHLTPEEQEKFQGYMKEIGAVLAPPPAADNSNDAEDTSAQ